MPAAIMRQLLKETIEDFLPEGAREAAHRAEESERQMIGWLAHHLDKDKDD